MLVHGEAAKMDFLKGNIQKEFGKSENAPPPTVDTKCWRGQDSERIWDQCRGGPSPTG